jgi:hypothetical protein
MDYECEEPLFPVSASCVTISNPDSISSSERGITSGIKTEESTYLNELYARKPLVVFISQRRKELRLCCNLV